jgi:hypothetical protein
LVESAALTPIHKIPKPGKIFSSSKMLEKKYSKIEPSCFTIKQENLGWGATK